MPNQSTIQFDGEAIGQWDGEEAEAVRLRWKNGVIVSREALPANKAPLDWHILPPLFDPQVNGFAGIDFQQDDLAPEQLLLAVLELRRHACSKILLTLITDHWTPLMRRLAHIKNLRDAHPELRDGIAGWHIEGPFLSEKPGYCGAHAPELMINPTEKHIDELRAITGDDPVLLTVAPERPGCLAAIERAVKAGITISLGHTDASSEILAAAVKAGARGFTHLGNGCPRTLDRQDNILWRALNQHGLIYGLIPDAIHVTPDLFRVFHHAAAGYAQERLDDSYFVYPSPFYYTTDAMAAAGAPPGTYQIGRLNLEVGADKVVRLPGQNLFAGSALTPLEGYQRACRMRPKQPLWQNLSVLPSILMGLPLPLPLQVGASADFCLVARGPDGLVRAGEIYIRGHPTALVVEEEKEANSSTR